jgi:hypothetical protein
VCNQSSQEDCFAFHKEGGLNSTTEEHARSISTALSSTKGSVDTNPWHVSPKETGLWSAVLRSFVSVEQFDKRVDVRAMLGPKPEE